MKKQFKLKTKKYTKLKTRKNSKLKVKKSLKKNNKGGGGLFGKKKSVNLVTNSTLPEPPKRLTMNNYLSEDRILYQDDNVCILNPKLKEGVIVWTNFTQPEGMESLCIAGLKTGKQLHNEGIDFGRGVHHPYIFFRAPFYNNPIDYSTVESEINSLYGELPKPAETGGGRAFIRVDPDNTYVYSSEIRAKYLPQIIYGTPEYWESKEREVKKSRKSLTEYLRIIKDNEDYIKRNRVKNIFYDLYSSEVYQPDKNNISNLSNYKEKFLDNVPINRNSEILVGNPHLESHYFVRCD